MSKVRHRIAALVEGAGEYPSADIHLNHIRYLIDYNLAAFLKG